MIMLQHTKTFGTVVSFQLYGSSLEKSVGVTIRCPQTFGHKVYLWVKASQTDNAVEKKKLFKVSKHVGQPGTLHQNSQAAWAKSF